MHQEFICCLKSQLAFSREARVYGVPIVLEEYVLVLEEVGTKHSRSQKKPVSCANILFAARL